MGYHSMKINENFKLGFTKWFKRAKLLIFILVCLLAFAWSPFIGYTAENNTFMITLDIFNISISNLTTIDIISTD